jgi:mono/diheme cytochrome c family protein
MNEVNMMKTLKRVAVASAVVLALLGQLGGDLQAGGQISVPDEARIERGREVYAYWCATCHARGPGMPGTTALAIKYRDGSPPAVLEDRVDLTPQLLRSFVRNGVSVMPFFRKTEISDADLDAIAAYLARKRDK